MGYFIWRGRQKISDCLGIALRRDAQDHDVLVCFGKGAQRRELTDAFRTPGGPEVQDDDPAAIRGERLDLAGEIGSREVRRFFARTIGLNSAGEGKEQKKRTDQKE